MLSRRQVLGAIFGAGCLCPEWLERLLKGKHSGQVKETERFDASARGIVERLLKGADDVDRAIARRRCLGGCIDNDYIRGLHNGLLLAQGALRDCESKLFQSTAERKTVFLGSGEPFDSKS